MKINVKKNKGITLIALVITIIVLLILAGVTIISLSGDNGILTRATQAKERTDIGKLDEQIKLTKNEFEADKTLGENTKEDDRLAFAEKIAKNIEGKQEKNKIETKDGKYEIMVNQDNSTEIVKKVRDM